MECTITAWGVVAAFVGGSALTILAGAALVWRLWKEWTSGRPARNPKL